jgi:hypothetical protein
MRQLLRKLGRSMNKNERVARAKIAANQCRRELEASLAREISLLHEPYEVKKKTLPPYRRNGIAFARHGG